MAAATDPFLKAVYNGRQLALKVSANSVYGEGVRGTHKGACRQEVCWWSVTSCGPGPMRCQANKSACHYQGQPWASLSASSILQLHHRTEPRLLRPLPPRLHRRHRGRAALPGDLLLGDLLWTGDDHGDAAPRAGALLQGQRLLPRCRGHLRRHRLGGLAGWRSLQPCSAGRGGMPLPAHWRPCSTAAPPPPPLGR